jgi:signal transduction histidine kinase
VDGTLRVSVADDGPGLPPERPQAPRPFFTTKPGGLGLGLPMALKIVRLHQGELSLENVIPRGLQVVISLPLRGPA